MLAIRTIPTIPAVFAGRGPRPARRLAQDSPTSPVLRKDWRPAICAVAARIPRYAIARPAVCPDCTPPAASMELGETADPPAVSAAVWAGMAAVRGASAVHGVRDSAHPDASRDASVACVFLLRSQSAESVCSVGTILSACVARRAVLRLLCAALIFVASSVDRKNVVARLWRVANMLRLLHDLHAIVGAEMKFLHEHADDFGNQRFAFRGVQFNARSHAVRTGVVTMIGPTLMVCSFWCETVENVDLRPNVALDSGLSR